MLFAYTGWFEKELLENNYLRKGINATCPLLCNIMITMDTNRCRYLVIFREKFKNSTRERTL